VSITLQSTVGGFSAEFRRKLPALEQAMIAHGLEPSSFVISKDRASSGTVPLIGPFFYDAASTRTSRCRRRTPTAAA
jgi:hypothetical protein